MGNSLRCCLACVLPCGALDLIRVVHLNGHVQEFSQPLTAGQILQANPGHVLTKPSTVSGPGIVRRVTILSPESQLRRGNIYFLIPAPKPDCHKKKPKKSTKSILKINSKNEVFPECEEEDVVVLKEKKKRKKESRRRDRRSSRGCDEAWRPHLDSIDEDYS